MRRSRFRLRDDRPERAGVKFKDSDLIGFPIQIIIGEKKIANGEVEVKDRKTKEIKVVKISEAASAVKGLIDKLNKAECPKVARS